MGFEVIEQRLQQLKPSPGRGEVVSFKEGFQVINDSYNSNPAALDAMIQFLRKVPHQKRKILVAGEMLELGPRSMELHQNCGKTAAKAKLDFILGIQGQARRLVEAAREEGYPDNRAVFFEDAIAAGEWLNGIVGSGDLVLVKGSRGVKTEQAIEVVKGNHPIVPAE